MSDGYFLVHRRLWKSPNFRDEPFTEREAWLWIMGQAAWKQSTVRYKDNVIDLQRGQLACSIRDMARKWQWHRSKVDRFLNRLVNLGVIKTETPPRHAPNIITICKYDEYQNRRDTIKPKTETPPRHLRDTSETQNKEVKEVKEVSEESSDSSAGKAIDPKKICYDVGKDLLRRYGVANSTAPALITKWLRERSPEDMTNIFTEAGRAERADIVAYIGGMVRARDGPPGKIVQITKKHPQQIALENLINDGYLK